MKPSLLITRLACQRLQEHAGLSVGEHHARDLLASWWRRAWFLPVSLRARGLEWFDPDRGWFFMTSSSWSARCRPVLITVFPDTMDDRQARPRGDAFLEAVSDPASFSIGEGVSSS